MCNGLEFLLALQDKLVLTSAYVGAKALAAAFIVYASLS